MARKDVPRSFVLGIKYFVLGLNWAAFSPDQALGFSVTLK
jgi:hypothetical protein